MQDKRSTCFSCHSQVLAPLLSHQNSVFHPEHLCVFKLGSVCIMVETTRKSWIACIMYFLVNGTLRNIFLPDLPAVLLTETLVAVSANSSVSGSRVNVKTLPPCQREISQEHFTMSLSTNIKPCLVATRLTLPRYFSSLDSTLTDCLVVFFLLFNGRICRVCLC